MTQNSRQTRLSLTINSNDAQVCYDRIVLLIASLALQRIRLSAKAEVPMTNTLKSAPDNIATYFGIFIDKYFPTTPPHQGSGQGNGLGPTIWVIISAILLTIMWDEDFGLNALFYLYQPVLVITGFVFVDDTAIINEVPSVNTAWEDLFKKTTKYGRYVERYIKSNIREALQLDKSYLCMIDYNI